jgi:hypothetical protein
VVYITRIDLISKSLNFIKKAKNKVQETKNNKVKNILNNFYKIAFKETKIA